MRNPKKGSAVMEVAFLMPWVAFLFIGVLDFGFYAYAAITVENAARTAVLYETASGIVPPDQPSACYYVLREMQRLPNVAPIVTTSTCNAAPVKVTTQTIASGTTVQGVVLPADATQITVVYTGLSMIPLPTLMGKYSFTRSAWMEQ